MSNNLFGWIPPAVRTPEMHEAHQQAVAEMPAFKIVGKSNANSDAKRVALWDCSRAVNNGKHFMVFHQITGSCVGNGGGQATWYLAAADVVQRGDRETPSLPFYLLPYGRSRFYAGMRGRGDGSMGSTFAKAISTDGILSADTPGLPQHEDDGGITWGQAKELEWSDGAAISQDWLQKAKSFLVKTTAQCPNADAVREAVCNYYSCTLASDWGGRMQCQTAGNPAVLLNEHADSWSHQMSCHGWQEHPSLGELFYILNSWGPNAHGTPPDDAPPGGFWIKKQDMEYICRQEEVFAFSQWDGFPGQDLSEQLFKIVGR